MSAGAKAVKWIVVVTAVMAWVLLHVWLRTETVRVGYTVRAGERRMEALIEDNRYLRMQLSSLRSVDRLEALARDEMDLSAALLARTVTDREPVAARAPGHGRDMELAEARVLPRD